MTEKPSPSDSDFTATSKREDYLQTILEKNPTLPDLSQVQKYPDSFGVILGLQDLLERSIEDYSENGKPQVIAVIGMQLSGKTKAIIKPAIDYVRTRTQIPVWYAGFEDALNISRSLDKTHGDVIQFPTFGNFDSSHESGERTAQDYDAVGLIFENLIKLGIKKDGIVIVEAPASGGFRFDTIERRGRDSGATVLQRVSSREGFEALRGYRLFVVGVIPSERQLIINFVSRVKQSSDVAEPTGSSVNGTLQAYGEALGWVPEFGAKGSQKKDSPSLEELLRIYGKKVIPYIIKDFLKIKKQRALILLNNGGNPQPVTSADLDPYRVLNTLSEEEKFSLALKGRWDFPFPK